MTMKGRESGMPDEAYWASFFEAEVAIAHFAERDRSFRQSVTDAEMLHG